MAGTTRFGYSRGGKDGGDEGGGPGDAEALGKATIFGRDAHLLRARATAVEPAPADPAAPTPPPADAPAARLPSRSGKSGFPARAGFWGRRNTQGELEPAATADLDESDLDLGDLDRPRRRLPPLAQHAIVVVVSAALSFLAVLVTLKLREPAPAPGGRPAGGGTTSDLPTLAPPAPPPTSPTAAPPPTAAPGARPSSPPKRPKVQRPARRASPQSPGDRVLPPSFRAP